MNCNNVSFLIGGGSPQVCVDICESITRKILIRDYIARLSNVNANIGLNWPNSMIGDNGRNYYKE